MRKVFYFAVAFILCFFVSCKTIKPSSEKNLNAVKILNQYYTFTANEIRKVCPKKIDECTTLVSIFFKEETRTLEYNFLLEEKFLKELEEEKKLKLHTILENALKENLAKEKTIEQFRKDEINFLYTYYDVNDEKIASIQILAGEY